MSILELLKYGSIASRFDCTIYLSPCDDVCASGVGFPALMQRPYDQCSLRAGINCRFMVFWDSVKRTERLK